MFVKQFAKSLLVFMTTITTLVIFNLNFGLLSTDLYYVVLSRLWKQSLHFMSHFMDFNQAYSLNLFELMPGYLTKVKV